MMNPTENRESKRHKHNAPLLYAFQHADIYYSATMCDYGVDGMCFLAGYELKPGTEIFIMIEDYAHSAEGHDIHEYCNAIVQWCEPMPNTDAFFYKVGVKYHEPSSTKHSKHNKYSNLK
jgi:hypothetical protein